MICIHAHPSKLKNQEFGLVLAKSCVNGRGTWRGGVQTYKAPVESAEFATGKEMSSGRTKTPQEEAHGLLPALKAALALINKLLEI